MKSFFTALVSIASALTISAGNIYVSPHGTAEGKGTDSSPLLTVADAFKQAREWRRLNDPQAADTIRIILEEGTYSQTKPIFLRPEDSGTPQSPTILCAKPGAVARVSGGIAVEGWTKGTDDPRVPAELRDKIWVADAPMAGTRMVETRQLYVDGRKALRATQFGEGEMQRMVDFNKKERTITVPTPSIDLSNARQLEMMVHQRWAIAILRVKEIFPNGDGNSTITFHDPESQLEFAHPWPQPVIGEERGNSSFTFMNALELVDQPGEWYQDYPSGKIYFYPFSDIKNLNAQQVVIPQLETIMQIDGSRERPVKHIGFENVTFEYSSWTRPSREGHVTLQGGFQLIDAYKLAIPGLPEKAELENQAWIGRPEAAITVKHGQEINFDGCTFTHMGNTGLDYVESVSHSSVENCRFTDIGGTALQIGKFPDGGFETHVPFIPVNADEICSDILVKDNLFLNCTNEDWGCVGIGAGYVANTTIEGNEVADVNYSGICVGWGWTPLESGMHSNVIRGNYVHHFAKQLWDAGGIYTLSNQPGSLIVDNRIEDLVDAPYATNHRAFYIYFDEATDGFTVDNNLCPNPEFGYNRPGPDLKVKNNGPKVILKNSKFKTIE